MPVLCYVIHPLTQTNTAHWVIVDVASAGWPWCWCWWWIIEPGHQSSKLCHHTRLPPSHTSYTTNSYCTRYLVCNIATDSSYRGAQTYNLQEKGKHPPVMGNDYSLPLPYNDDIADGKLQRRNTQNSDTLLLQIECKLYMQRAIHVMHMSFNTHNLSHTKLKPSYICT